MLLQRHWSKPRLYLSQAIAALAIWVLLAAAAGEARAQRIEMIRDAEIEATIRALATPLLQAGGLPPGDVQIHLVRDNSLNAFVAGGLRIFIYTGLLQRTETPNQLAGVLAHEIGHITGGHLARTREELRGASAAAILSTVLGVAAAIATGDGQAMAAVAMGGQQIATRNLLQYSRTQEAAADQAALQLLDSTRQSAAGLGEFFDVLAEQELLLASQQDPYLRTHPFSRDRVESLQRHLDQSRYTGAADSPEAMAAHARMRAKLSGFLDPIWQVNNKYPVTDQSTPAVYARAVAYHRQGDFQQADEALAELLAREPEDPYFLELKGQLLFERGDAEGAVSAYSKAVSASRQEPLIVFDYARAALQLNDPAQLQQSIDLMERALAREPDSGPGWRVLGTAYGRTGDLGRAALALAESEWLFGNLSLVDQQARRAQAKLKKGTPEWLRAEDLRLAAERERERRENR